MPRRGSTASRRGLIGDQTVRTPQRSPLPRRDGSGRGAKAHHCRRGTVRLLSGGAFRRSWSGCAGVRAGRLGCAERHRQHDRQRQRAAQPHPRQPTDERVVEPNGPAKRLLTAPRRCVCRSDTSDPSRRGWSANGVTTRPSSLSGMHPRADRTLLHTLALFPHSPVSPRSLCRFAE